MDPGGQKLSSERSGATPISSPRDPASVWLDELRLARQEEGAAFAAGPGLDLRYGTKWHSSES